MLVSLYLTFDCRQLFGDCLLVAFHELERNGIVIVCL